MAAPLFGLVGTCLPVLMNRKSVRVVHTRVKVAYKAHNEAARGVLEEISKNVFGGRKAKSNTSNTGELVESVIKEEEKKVEEALENEEVGAVDTRKEEEGKIVFKTLENGKHVCFPLIGEEFSELLFDGEGAAHASFVPRAECEWYNQLRNVGIEAMSTLSSCVPDSFVFA